MSKAQPLPAIVIANDLLSGDDFNMQGHVFPPVPAARANQKISGA